MTYRTLKIQRDHRGVFSIHLNRPEIRNAFNEEMISELTQVFGSEVHQKEVRVVVLQGEGAAFCAGGDLNWMKKSVNFTYEENLQDTQRLSKLFATMNECPKPVIGLIHGAAIGGGVGLVSVCDFVITSSETVFSLSEVRLGIVPACIGPFVIAKIGPSHARRFFMSAERFSAAQAKDIGLVHEVVQNANELKMISDRVVGQILQCSPNALKAAKQLILDLSWPERRGQLQDYIGYISKTLSDLRVSSEGQEGVRAFLEKRKPSWLLGEREMGNRVEIFEVGLRDGLQNEPQILSTSEKIKFAQALVECGIRDLELGAFVRPDRVPQMADSERLFRAIEKKRLRMHTARAWSLVPNRIGLERALNAGCTHFALFTAATRSFAERNIGMSIPESIREFNQVVHLAQSALGKRAKFRGYVSTAFGCPFEGKTAPSQALRVVEALAELPVDQISIGDTIGVASPAHVEAVIRPALQKWGPQRIAVHFHDTRGTALANSLRALDLGVRVIDSSFGGLGGCPFAPGAAGNLATEDLVYMLNGMKLSTGIDLDALARLSLRMAKKLNRPITSRYVQAWLKSRRA